MPSTYSNLKIQLMATGENNTTWGDVTNVNLGTALEEAIVGSADVAFSNADVTLTLTDTNSTQSARNMRLNLTGTATTGYNLVVPAIEKPYIVNNGTDGTITVKNTTGTGIAVPAGKTMWLFNNGTNVVDVVTHLSSVTLGSALPATSGGTGQSSYAVGDILFASTTTALSKLADVATGNALISGGVGVAPSYGKIGLTTHVSGTLPVTNGGTGQTTYTNGQLLIGNTTGNTLTKATLTAGTNISITNGAGAITINSTDQFVGTVTSVAASGGTTGLTFSGSPITTSGTLTLAGTLAVANGGTGVTTSTGTGSVVLSNSPTLVTPTLGAASATSIANGLGAAATPSYTFTGDLNTGMWSPAADTLAFSTNSLERMRVINAGNVVINYNTTFPTALAIAPQFSVGSIANGTGGGITLGKYRNNAAVGADFELTKSRSSTVGANSIGFNNDLIGTMTWSHADGTGFVQAASISANIDGIPDTNDMPGRLVFSTTADGASTPTERMRVDSSGNVGIGTTSATSRLRVSDTSPTDGIVASFNNTTSALGVESGIRLEQGSSAQLRCDLVTYRAGANAGLDFAIKQSDNTGTSQTRFYITELGNVGIGTTTPASDARLTLDNGGAGDVGIMLRRSGSGQLDTAIQNAGGALALHTGNDAATIAGISERMRIASSGNVGIGITAPLGLLHVNSTGTTNAIVSGSDAARLVINGDTANSGDTGTEDASLIFNTDGVYDPTVNSGLGFSGFRLGYLNGPATNTLIFVDILSGVDRERMRIDASGNVGIGTSSPTASLSVVGAQTLTRGLDMGLTGVDATCYVSQKRATVEGIMGPLSTRMLFGTISNHDVAVQTNNTERMRITSAGNVGIGTSAPVQPLQVRQDQDGTTAALIQNRNGSGTPVSAMQFISGPFDLTDNRYAMISSAGGSNTTLQFWTGSGATPTERMRITDTGNVGINEAAPDYKLDVNGTFGFTPGASVTPVDNGDVVFELTNNTTLTVKAKGSDGVVRSGTIILV